MKIAIIQICSKLDPLENLSKISSFIKEALNKEHRLSAVFLPEAFYSLSDGRETTPYLLEKHNEHYLEVKDLALKNNVALIGGSCATRSEGKIFNRAYHFGSDGVEKDYYDKLHLFKIELKAKENKTIVDESLIYTHGSHPCITHHEGWKIGLSICFDVRFPELYRYYQSQKVDLITIASAFTVPTGKAHWETLIRARAIETQAYVVASAQWGDHNDKIKTYGHSLVVDPWGEVIADLGKGEKFQIVDLDKDHINTVRSRLNINAQHIFS